ncbi:cell division protein FtsB [Acetoanaerobium pronyense]|uniref:Cell division protein FtsB n=1 Tax=Acetoanaerobium pronyense TaxID=1482736 RepID=A0ABS4KH59_9FIRM|nr:septum formation initiator family protein [Acetoanaerobium pronyense]MBP2027119.1 cell division protein FtsB [Acetoanaerobium pronyense]
MDNKNNEINKIQDMKSRENEDFKGQKETVVNIADIKEKKELHYKTDKETTKKPKKEIDFMLLGIVAIIIVASISMIFTYIDQEMQIAELREQRAVILEKEKVEEKEIERLEKILSQVGTMEFIERQARERLGMIKPGETIYIDLNKMRN